MIGEAGLTTALHDVGYTLTERDPDYVVLGETRTYSFERITRAIRLVADGARFIATNPDATGPTPDGPLPATGSVAALISHATGVEPYFVGKPNPLMMRSALNAIDAHSETTAMIGDRMDTDIVSGLEAGLETILVLTGVTTREEAERHPYRAVADRRLGRGSARRPGLMSPDRDRPRQADVSRLGDRTWPELADSAAALAVPLGATEQHGPHLPLSTDTDIACALAARLAARSSGVVLAPALEYGASGEHQAFAGTLSIGQDAVELVLVELARSASETFPRIVFVSPHGGNTRPVRRAVRRLRAEGRDVRAWSPAIAWSGDAHAGRIETSVMLALHPSRVRLDAAASGEQRPLEWVTRRPRLDPPALGGALPGRRRGIRRRGLGRLRARTHTGSAASRDGASQWRRRAPLNGADGRSPRRRRSGHRLDPRGHVLVPRRAGERVAPVRMRSARSARPRSS